MVPLQSNIGNGVTRLGEFSPIGRLFTLGSILLITEVAQIFVLPFSKLKNCVLILAKNGLGYSLGNSFAYASGHPAIK
jgi:hypothetical protein